MSSICVMCKKELLPEESMKDGRPAICAWVPPGAGKSVYAIVSAHIACMGVVQLQQAVKSIGDDVERTSSKIRPMVLMVIERRLSEFLANPPAAPPLPTRDSSDRRHLLEID